MTAPAAPVIRVRASHPTAVRVLFQPVVGATNYNLYADTVTGPTTLVANYVVAYSGDWYQITFNTRAEGIYIRLTAVNAGAEESAYSNEVHVVQGGGTSFGRSGRQPFGG